MTIIEICAIISVIAAAMTAIINPDFNTKLWASTTAIWALQYFIK